MLVNGVVTATLMSAAAHEAGLLAHPYIGIEHLELARLRLAGEDEQYETYRQLCHPGVRRRWWRPLGPRSSLRRAGLAETEAARRRAERGET